MPQGPLRKGQPDGPKDRAVRSVVNILQSLRGYARRLIPSAIVSRYDASDLVQDCFIRARDHLVEFAKLDICGCRDRLQRYMRQIVRIHWRTRKREEERLETYARSCEISVPGPQCGEPADESLQVALRGLAPRNARLVVLVLVEGLPLREAARQVGMSRSEASRRFPGLKAKVQNNLRPEPRSGWNGSPRP